MKYWHPHLPFGQHISVSTLVCNCIINNKLINNKFRFSTVFKINLIYKTTDICSIFNADLSFSRNQFLWFLQISLILCSWICGFKHYRQQSMGKFYFVWFLFLWVKWTMKSAKIRIPQLIMISQYVTYWWRKQRFRSKLLTCRKSLTNFSTLFWTVYTSHWTPFLKC
jgi:hypothetical protein